MAVLLAACAMLAGCADGASTTADAHFAGRSDASAREPADAGSSASPADAMAADAESAATPADPAPLRGLVESASGVFAGVVTELQQESVEEQIRAVGINWRIYYDTIRVQTDRSLGTAEIPATLARLIPVRCEGFDDQGMRIPDAQLSSCTGRNASNSPNAGQRIIGFVQGGGPVMLTLGLSVDASGQVDVSPIEAPPSDRTEDAIWSLIEQQWAALGRP